MAHGSRARTKDALSDILTFLNRGCNRPCNTSSKQTTCLVSDDRITITHPFHPKSGEVCKVIGMRKSMNRRYLICIDVEDSELSVPIEHTSMPMATDAEQHPHKSKCDHGYEDLLELKRIVSGIMRKVNYVAMS